MKLGLFRHGHLYPGTIKAIRRLSELGDVIVITHRPKHAVHDTLAWLAYQNLPLSGIHILTGQEPKSSAEPKCDAYLDDKIENCFDLHHNTQARLVALMDRPWNQRPCRLEGEGRHLRRVNDWQHFIDYVEELA